MIRVLIAEDQYLTREGTKRLLEDQPGIEVVGVAADGTEVTERALAIRPEIGVIVLSQHADEEYVSALLEDGAEGYGCTRCESATSISSCGPSTKSRAEAQCSTRASSRRNLLGARPVRRT